MPDFADSPLTHMHLGQIQDALRVIDQAEKQIELARRAGIDVSKQDSECKESKEKLLRIKNVYFPGQ